MKIKNLILGEGRPKICIPLVASSIDALQGECKRLSTCPFDLLEWRIDYLLANPDFQYSKDLERAFAIVREYSRGAVILTTLRTKSQGGSYAVSDSAYASILHFLLTRGMADLLDVEYGHEGLDTETLLPAGKKAGIPILMSYHRFEGPIPLAEMIGIYERMKALGADVLKIASMPKTPKDTANILLSAATVREAYPDTPVIAIGMGGPGQLTRVAGCEMGAPLTFASGETASAPGQLSAKDAKAVLGVLYGEK